MTTNIQTNRVHVSLHTPTTVAGILGAAYAIEQGMTNNALFPAPTVPMPTFTQSIATYQSRSTAAAARTKGAVQARDEQGKVLVAQMQTLATYVQTVADANPAQAESIIHGAGMGVRKTPLRPPRVFAVMQANVSGAVKLVAPRAAKSACYNWQYSVDGGKTWVALPDTLRASTSAAGIAAGTTIEARFRAVTKSGVGDWSQTVTMLVK